MLRTLLAITMLTVALAAAPVLSPDTAAAQSAPSGAPRIFVVLPTAPACPAGIEAFVPPVDPEAPARLAIVVPPGPAGAGCAGGLALLMDFLPPVDPDRRVGTAVALPLTTASCAAGTAVLEGIAEMLIPPIDPDAPPASSTVDACPAGDAALAEIKRVITLLREPFDTTGCPAGAVAPLPPSWPSRTPGTAVLQPPDPARPECLPGTLLLVGYTPAGSPRGLLGVAFPPIPGISGLQEILFIRPGTVQIAPGVSQVVTG